MEVNKSFLMALLKALLQHKIKVPSKGLWKKAYDNYNIGTQDLSKSRVNYFITSQDRSKIKDLLIANGIDPENDTPESLNKESRTESSKKRTNEKLISKKVKEDYISIRITGLNNTEDLSFTGMPYYKALEMEFDYILVIENFETFIYVDVTLLPLPQDVGRVAVIYRGDKDSSPRGLTQFLNNWNNKSKVYYWGDFDPIGISIAISKEKYDAIILPFIDSKDMSEYSKIDVYYRHESYMPKLEKNIVLSSFIEKMKNEKLAITQELLMSHDFPLVLLEL